VESKNNFVIVNKMNSTPKMQHEIKYIEVFGKKISRAAFYTLVSGIFLSLVVSVFVPYGFFIGVYILLVVLLASYNVNCAQVGHCHVWAWILTIIYIVYVSISIIIIIANPEAWASIVFRTNKTSVSAPKLKGSKK
jgi:hypothetical protein